MKKVLITGITGQDGSYLAELLLKIGYEVHGIRRRSSSFNTGRLEHIIKDSHDKTSNLYLHYGDMLDSVNLVNLLREINPTEIYNLAAQSHVRISFDQPIYTTNVTGLGTLNILESVKLVDPTIHFLRGMEVIDKKLIIGCSINNKFQPSKKHLA